MPCKSIPCPNKEVMDKDDKSIYSVSLFKDFDINIVIESVNGNEIQNTALDSNLLVSTIGEFRFLSAQESIRRIIRAKIGYEKQK